MKFLPDVNVLFPLLVSRHTHRAAAVQWFDRTAIAEVALCRLTRLGILRLLCTPAVMGPDVLPPKGAIEALQVLENDERIICVSEPLGLDRELAECVPGCVSSPNLWSDAYLSALAIVLQIELVSFDRGFGKFPRLHFSRL